MDRLVAKFDRIAEKVNHTSYGYSGFFDVVKIEEANLDRMIDFDHQLVESVDKIAEEVSTFKSEIVNQKFENAKDHVEGLTETIEAFESTLDSREEVILGVS
jgi:phage-related minor tail protein